MTLFLSKILTLAIALAKTWLILRQKLKKKKKKKTHLGFLSMTLRVKNTFLTYAEMQKLAPGFDSFLLIPLNKRTCPRVLKD